MKKSIKVIITLALSLSLLCEQNLGVDAASHAHTSACKQTQTLTKHSHTRSECYGFCGNWLAEEYSANEYGHGWDYVCSNCGSDVSKGHPWGGDSGSHECIDSSTQYISWPSSSGGTVSIPEPFSYTSRTHTGLICTKSTSYYYDEYGNQYNTATAQVPICSKVVKSLVPEK